MGNISIFFFFNSFFFCSMFIYLFYLRLCWVFVSVRGLSLVAASGGHSLSRPLPLRSTRSRCAGSAIAAHGPSCSAACGILPDQGSNPCPLHWQADSQPLHHQGSIFLINLKLYVCWRVTDNMQYVHRFLYHSLHLCEYKHMCLLGS